MDGKQLSTNECLNNLLANLNQYSQGTTLDHPKQCIPDDVLNGLLMQRPQQQTSSILLLPSSGSLMTPQVTPINIDQSVLNALQLNNTLTPIQQSVPLQNLLQMPSPLTLNGVPCNVTLPNNDLMSVITQNGSINGAAPNNSTLTLNGGTSVHQVPTLPTTYIPSNGSGSTNNSTLSIPSLNLPLTLQENLNGQLVPHGNIFTDTKEVHFPGHVVRTPLPINNATVKGLLNRSSITTGSVATGSINAGSMTTGSTTSPLSLPPLNAFSSSGASESQSVSSSNPSVPAISSVGKPLSEDVNHVIPQTTLPIYGHLLDLRINGQMNGINNIATGITNGITPGITNNITNGDANGIANGNVNVKLNGIRSTPNGSTLPNGAITNGDGNPFRRNLSRYRCSGCSSDFLEHREFYDHLQHRADLKQYPCWSCCKSFARMGNLSNHIRIVHEGQTPQSVFNANDSKLMVRVTGNGCNGQTLSTDSKLNGVSMKNGVHSNGLTVTGLHSNMHSNGISNAFKKEDHLSLAVMEGFPPEEVVVKHNNIIMSQSSALKIRNVRDEVKPFKCDQCPKTFKNKSGLSNHKIIHNGEKPHKCRFAGCNKAFSRSCDLTRHVRLHTGDKPFKCKYEGCGKSFTRSVQLRLHLMDHTGQRPFKCDICKKGFKTLQNAQIHMRIHTGEKPYSCVHCRKRFTQSSIHLQCTPTLLS